MSGRQSKCCSYFRTFATLLTLQYGRGSLQKGMATKAAISANDAGEMERLQNRARSMHKPV
jgi:hypothetical protein